MLFNKGVDSCLVEACEDLDIAFSIVVAYVEPELVELVWSGAFRIEPNIARLCLTKFLAVRLGDERTGEGECLYLVA